MVQEDLNPNEIEEINEGTKVIPFMDAVHNTIFNILETQIKGKLNFDYINN